MNAREAEQGRKRDGEPRRGIVFTRLQDRSLAAYKEFINTTLRALRGDKYTGDDHTPEDVWEKDWKKFWAVGDKAENADD